MYTVLLRNSRTPNPMSTRPCRTRSSRDPHHSYRLVTVVGESTNTIRTLSWFPRQPGPRAEVCRGGEPVASCPDTPGGITAIAMAAVMMVVAVVDGSRTSAPFCASGVTSTVTSRTNARMTLFQVIAGV